MEASEVRRIHDMICGEPDTHILAYLSNNEQKHEPILFGRVSSDQSEVGTVKKSIEGKHHMCGSGEIHNIFSAVCALLSHYTGCNETMACHIFHTHNTCLMRWHT